VQLSQIPKTIVSFDEPNLIGSAGLVPVMRLARRAGLEQQVTRRVKIPGPAGYDAAAKVACIVAGMTAGADSIDDLDVLREGATAKVLPGVKAPRRWARSYAGSPSLMSASSARSPPPCW